MMGNIYTRIGKIETLDIFISDICIGLLGLNGIRLDSICFDFELFLGDISQDINHINRVQVYDKFVKFCDDEFKRNVDFDFKHIQSIIHQSGKLRVWVSKRCIEDYMALLYLVAHYIDKEIIVVSIPKNKMHDDNAFFDKIEYCERLKNLEDIKSHTLDNNEKMKLKDEWQKQQKINSDIRMMENGKIINQSYSDYFQEILHVLNGTEYMNTWDIVERMNEKSVALTQVVINEMIDRQLIEVRVEENESQNGWYATYYKGKKG